MEETRGFPAAKRGGHEEKAGKEQRKAGKPEQDETHRGDPVCNTHIERVPLNRADSVAFGGHGYLSLPSIN